MMSFTIPQNEKGKLLFDEELEISEKAVRKLRSEASIDEGRVSLLLTRKNLIAVRQPKPENLVAYLLEQTQKLPSDIEKEVKEGYDFYHIALICSFLPDPDCKFTWARLTVKMQCVSKQGDSQKQKKPIVCDMFPDKIEHEVKKERTFSISGGLKYSFLDLNIENLKIEKGEKSEFIVYQPEIISYGRGGSTFYWNFEETVQKSIYGDKILFAIIKKPKDSQVFGQFKIDVHVETIKGIMGIPISAKRKKEVVDIQYEIC